MMEPASLKKQQHGRGGNVVMNEDEIHDEEKAESVAAGASLPSPDEIKADRNTTSIDNRPLYAIVVLLFLAAIGVGLGVGLTAAKKNNANNEISTAFGGVGGIDGTGGSTTVSAGGSDNSDANNDTKNQKDRRERILNYIVANGVSDIGDFDYVYSPQNQALNFMVHDQIKSKYIPNIEIGESIDTDIGYKFLTRYILSVFFYSTGGPTSWNFNLFFNSDQEICDWFFVFNEPYGQLGVLCNRDSMDIVGLSFITNGLNGRLPDELGFLTTLTYIESVGHNIKGTIPTTFAKLSNLETLILPFNVLSGSIPPEIGDLEKLDFLYLADNLLTGTLPTFKKKDTLRVLAVDDNAMHGPIDSVWELKSLEHAYMEQNTFTGQFPSSIVNAHPNLITFDVSNNELDGKLPLDLFLLSRLDILDLHGNQFTGTVPSNINLSYNLTFLAIQDNELSGPIPSEIGNLAGLNHLDLSNNKLAGTFPNTISNLKNLTYAFLGQNSFTPGPIPTFFYSLNGLRELSLKSTSRSGQISPLVGALSELILLDLDDNSLTGSVPPQLGNMPNLQFILLNRNQLEGTVPVELSFLPSLQFILLDRNNINGTMEAICESSVLNFASADCNSEVDCGCCTLCCSDDEDCHDLGLVNTVDWETNYDRLFFNFGNDAMFYQALNTDPAMP